MRHVKQIGRALSVLSVLLLVGCGGGGLTSIAGGVGTGGTGITFGTVTGFGSIVVDGMPYSSATPQYFGDTDQSEGVLVSSAAIALGSRLRLQLDTAGNPTNVRIEPELVGPVSQMRATEFVVNGVTVRVNAKPADGPVTYYSGLSSLSAIAVSMQIQVHGAFGLDANQQPYVLASLIEQLPSSNTITRVSGFVSNFNAGAGTFQLGSTVVQTGAATSVLPAGASLANGEWVNVWSNVRTAANGTVAAGVVRMRTLAGVAGPVQIGGVVSNLAGSQFQVSGVAIDAGAPALASIVRSLSAGQYVVVQGEVNPSNGTLTASNIRSYATQPAQIELHGTITDFVDASNFLVRGVPVDASQAQFAGPASAASLRNGAFVEVHGNVNGNVVTATSISVAGVAPTGSTINVRGTVSQLDSASGSFVLTGASGESTAVKLASNVAYANGSAAQLVNGANVEVEATNTSSGLVAYGVFYLRTGSPASESSMGSVETHGIAYGVGVSSFTVNGVVILVNGIAPQGGALVNGAKVEVRFTSSGGQNLAQAISIDVDH